MASCLKLYVFDFREVTIITDIYVTDVSVSAVLLKQAFSEG